MDHGPRNTDNPLKGRARKTYSLAQHTGIHGFFGKAFIASTPLQIINKKNIYFSFNDVICVKPLKKLNNFKCDWLC